MVVLHYLYVFNGFPQFILCPQRFLGKLTPYFSIICAHTFYGKFWSLLSFLHFARATSVALMSRLANVPDIVYSSVSVGKRSKSGGFQKIFSKLNKFLLVTIVQLVICYTLTYTIVPNSKTRWQKAYNKGGIIEMLYLSILYNESFNANLSVVWFSSLCNEES